MSNVRLTLLKDPSANRWQTGGCWATDESKSKLSFLPLSLCVDFSTNMEMPNGKGLSQLQTLFCGRISDSRLEQKSTSAAIDPEKSLALIVDFIPPSAEMLKIWWIHANKLTFKPRAGSHCLGRSLERPLCSDIYKMPLEM